MRCPIDQTELRMTERQGVEIDYCPTCRGVWLDRGELDKIIERSALTEAHDDRYEEAEYRSYEERPGLQRHRRKRRSFLSELFEFD